MGGVTRITRANAQFQQWEALLGNRTKRHRAGEFLVQGVRPISLAIDHGWAIRAVIYDAERSLSQWADRVLGRVSAQRVAMSAELLGRLGGKGEEVPELVAVVELPPDDLTRIAVGPSFLAVAFDRPTVPGNIGTIVRSVDAFGGAGLIVTGHGADPYDPKAVRASTGSLFALPVVRASSQHPVLEWVEAHRGGGTGVTVVGTDENGSLDLAAVDLTGPVLLVVGNETAGLSAGWMQGCDHVVRIPIRGSASSLNVANAASIALYEAARQRGG